MKMRSFVAMMAVAALVFAGQSCTQEDPDPFDSPVAFPADNNWVEGALSAGEIVWYKVTGDESFTKLYIEWAEVDHHGESRNYTGDIKVSAYMLDGETPYFEEKDNGYADKSKSFQLEGEHEVLLKVELNDDSRPGTFAIRAQGTSAAGDVTYTTLSVEYNWTDSTIADGEVIGYLVDCGCYEWVSIIWAEAGSPEEGYTADIKGSVLFLDGETPYADLGNGKDILNKNKSQSDDPKSIHVDITENAFKIHIQVNTAPGSFAIKVIPLE